MNKKFFVSLAIILFSVFSFSFCLATDGSGIGSAANNVRNFVGGVENTVENAAMDVSNASRDVTGGAENTMDGNRTSGMTGSNSMTNSTGMTGYNGNNGYTATRTNANTTMGMSQNAWTWLILGVAAIAIIAVVWYYSMQFTNTGRRGNNDDDDNID